MAEKNHPIFKIVKGIHLSNNSLKIVLNKNT
jgi:hypothetical protein